MFFTKYQRKVCPKGKVNISQHCTNLQSLLLLLLLFLFRFLLIILKQEEKLICIGWQVDANILLILLMFMKINTIIVLVYWWLWNGTHFISLIYHSIISYCCVLAWKVENCSKEFKTDQMVHLLKEVQHY